MFNIRSFTKLVKIVNSGVFKHQLRTRAYLYSTSSDNDDMDMENMATARRFIDDYMRRIDRGEKKEEGEKDDCIKNFKCEITRKNKRGGDVDCNCELVCMAKVSETMTIHKEDNK